MTPQQGDTDRLTLNAQQAAVAVAQANIAAQEALVRVLRQQKAYQSVVAPLDGIITQRNVDTGSLVQSGTTFMFTLMQSDVIRTQVYVPQDAAFGVANGVDAVVHVPEIPDRTFPGKVTRFAHALAPGTRTLLTEVDVPNPDGAFSPGMYVTIELHIPAQNLRRHGACRRPGFQRRRHAGGRSGQWHRAFPQGDGGARFRNTGRGA